MPCHRRGAKSAFGPPITLDQAKKVMAAAEEEAKKNNWAVAIAILDSGCNLVLLHKLDNTNLAGPQIAQDKAYTACAFRVSTKAAQDNLAKGGEGLRFLQLHRMTAVEGALPIVTDGKTVGAIGVSGATSEQDGQIAGAEALK
jgi:glc operon protein GlcG